MKFTQEQIEMNTNVLCITQSGKVLMTSPLLNEKPNDYQEGRVVEIMYTFDNVEPYFLYYLNEDYYIETATNNGLTSINNSTNFEKIRENISTYLLNILLKSVYEKTGVNLSGRPARFSHNYVNTNNLMYVDSLNDWYPVRHAMNEGEDAAEIKIKRVNKGIAKITDYISVYDLSPREAEETAYESEDNTDNLFSDDGDDSWLENWLSEESEGIDHEDYELIKEAPFIIFILMALADGEIDLKETTALAEVILNPSTFKNDFLVQVIRDAIPEITPTSIPECLAPIMNNSPDYLNKLQELKRAIDENLDASEALQFKQALIKLGYKIADASGGLFGLGSRVCKQEEQMLRTIAKVLGVTGV